MNIQLTGEQWNAVSHRIPEQWKRAMRENRRQTYGRSHNYDLPAICWRRLFDHLRAGATGPLGGNTRGPDALYSAISRIIKRVMEIEQHPALTPGRYVKGISMEVIPAWGDPIGVRRGWSPYPFSVEGCYRFVLLVPRWEKQRGWDLTTWTSTTDHDLLVAQSATYSEEFQLLLAGQFSPVGVDLGGVPQD